MIRRFLNALDDAMADAVDALTGKVIDDANARILDEEDFPVGENPCLPSMPTLNEMAALRKALAQAEHRASLANRDYVAMRLDRDQWKAKYYTSESRRTL